MSKFTHPSSVNVALNLRARLFGGAPSAPGSSPSALTAQIFVALAANDSCAFDSGLSPRRGPELGDIASLVVTIGTISRQQTQQKDERSIFLESENSARARASALSATRSASSAISHVAMCSGLFALPAARTSALSSRRVSSVTGEGPRFRPSEVHHKRISRRAPLSVRAELPSLVPADSTDALGRFRKVMTVLYFTGGALHFPDLLGEGPISRACGVDAFSDLNPLLQFVTLGWAVLGPVASFGLATNKTWGDAIVVAVASTEVILGINFADAMAPSAIPSPVVAAQVVSLMSVFAIYTWKKTEEAAEAER